jgi:hypothetical protein
MIASIQPQNQHDIQRDGKREARTDDVDPNYRHRPLESNEPIASTNEHRNNNRKLFRPLLHLSSRVYVLTST